MSARADEAKEQPLARALIERLKKRDRAMVFLITVIAIGGLVSAVIFGLLLYQMQIDAELARQGIRLNREAVEIARANTQNQLRAYASILEFRCGACGDNAGPDEVFLKVANDGQTPAINVVSNIGWNAGDERCGTAGSGFAYAYTQARYFKTFRTLGRGVQDLTTFEVDREAVPKAKSENKRLCVFGSVNYATIFKDLGERETRFCYWYSRGSERAPCEDRNDQN